MSSKKHIHGRRIVAIIVAIAFIATAMATLIAGTSGNSRIIAPADTESSVSTLL